MKSPVDTMYSMMTAVNNIVYLKVPEGVCFKTHTHIPYNLINLLTKFIVANICLYIHIWSHYAVHLELTQSYISIISECIGKRILHLKNTKDQAGDL